MAADEQQQKKQPGAQPELVADSAHEKAGHGDGPAVSESHRLATRLQHLSLSAQAIHADDYLNSHQAVAPPMHVSTTYRYSDDPDKLSAWENVNPNNPHDSHVYSRDSAPNTTRLEAILSSTLRGPALTYASGLAAFHALLVQLNPRRVAIGGGYHGCHGVLELMRKLTGLEVVELSELESENGAPALGKGDLIHVETPLNPTGEARDLELWSRRARARGAWLSCDATFAPPPLLDPLAWGVDVVMHSGTKYIGGHSDMLCGVLAVHPRHAATLLPGLRDERMILGSVMGSLEGWLGVRSLRTLEVRVRKQSADAGQLVRWLTGAASGGDGDKDQGDAALVRDMVESVHHASLQRDHDSSSDQPPAWLTRQMPQGFGPVFSFVARDEDAARRLPSKLRLFHHATSLGGVESLIEWRAMTDRTVDRRLLRVSVGLEGWEDLRDDLVQGMRALRDERAAGAAAAAK